MALSKILVWNVRGLNDRARRDSVRKMVDHCRPTIVCLQETKLALISERDVLSILGPDFLAFVFLRAQTTRGGILVAWRLDACTAISHRVHPHSVTIQFQSEDEPSWWLTGVYGPQSDTDKISFLEELREVRSFCPGP